MKVYEALANAFAAEGTSAVFGMTGDSNSHWLQILRERHGGTLYQVRHEGAGLAMADGWARMSGIPGVCTATDGPGITQLATTMVVASRARTPMVVFAGDKKFGDTADAQCFNQERFAAAIEAGFVRVTSPDDVYSAVQNAFYLAKTKSMPVMLNLPLNLVQQEVSDLDEYVPSAALINTAPIYPNPDRMKIAADLLAASKYPVIIVGRGAMRSGAREEVLKIAERTGAVVATTLMAKNWLNDYPYQVGLSGLFATRTAMELFAEADCVLAVGASLNQYTTEHGYLYPNAKFIHLDPQPSVVMGDGRVADCYVQSDARLGLEVLDQLLEERDCANTGFHQSEVVDKLSTALVDNGKFEIPQDNIDPRVAVRTLDEAMPPEIGLVLGGGQQNHFGIMLANKARSWILPNLHFACIGQGMTTAIGGVIATGKPAYLMEGDAGFMMHLAEFETACRYEVPLFVAVMNDQGLAAEVHLFHDKKPVDVDMFKIKTPDLGVVGAALGGRGAIVRNADEMKKAAAEFAAKPGPMLVDVRVAQAVSSIPNRRRMYGQDV